MGSCLCSWYLSRIWAYSRQGMVAQGSTLLNRISNTASTMGHGAMRTGKDGGIGMGNGPVIEVRMGYCLQQRNQHTRLVSRQRGVRPGDIGADGRSRGEYQSGDLRWEQAEGRAERIVAEEFRRLGWTESDLVGQPKRAAGKLALAARLRRAFATPERLRPRRRETTMPLRWIAACVRLGTSKSANRNLHRWMKANPEPETEATIGSVADKADPA